MSMIDRIDYTIDSMNSDPLNGGVGGNESVAPLFATGGGRMRVTMVSGSVEPSLHSRDPDDVLALATSVYEGLGEDEIEEVTTIMVEGSLWRISPGDAEGDQAE